MKNSNNNKVNKVATVQNIESRIEGLEGISLNRDLFEKNKNNDDFLTQIAEGIGAEVAYLE